MEEYYSTNVIRAALKIALVSPFYSMIFSDSPYTRKLFFQAFIVCVPLIAVCNLFDYSNPLINTVVFARQLCWLTNQAVDEKSSEEDETENN